MANPITDLGAGIAEGITGGVKTSLFFLKKIIKDKQIASIFFTFGLFHGLLTKGPLLLSIGKSLAIGAGIAVGFSAVAGLGATIFGSIKDDTASFSKKLGRVVGVPLLTAAIAFGAVAGYNQIDKMINPPKKVGFNIERSAEFNAVAKKSDGEFLKQASISKPVPIVKNNLV